MKSEINMISNVGLYIRLSREDDDAKLESESITNQKSLLTQYVKENNLRIIDIYVDDGYSGTNFDRPEFKRMIDDILKGKINMVITKDMSRLGRDYIGTGELIEKFFPSHGVRYIAVTDNIDTYLDNSNNDIAPFKAIMNDMYAKDISKKIRSSLRAKQKEGKWVGGRTPFGYDVDPDNHNHLIINQEQAIIVKRIYDMAMEGLSYYKIAEKLQNERVKTPASYYSFEWRGHYKIDYSRWQPKTIGDILKNRIYTGDLVQNKRTKINYKIKKVIKNNPKDYIIVPNTHEAIIDKDLFFEVQKRLPKNVGRNEKKENHLFDGLLYCGDCGHRISIQSRRKKDNRCYTICNYYRTYMKYKLCTTHSNNYDELEDALLSELRNLCKKYMSSNIKEKINSTPLSDTNNINKEIELLKEEINKIILNLDDIYIDKLNKKISEEQYIRVKEKLELGIKNNQDRINKLSSKIMDIKHITNKQKKIDKYINDFLSLENPSRDLIVNLVEKVEIFKDKTININVTFSNIY